jgi:streptogrisin C
MRFKPYVLPSILVSALALGVTPALGAADDPGRDDPVLSEEIRSALQRDLGLSADEVKKQEALQAGAIKLDQKLQDSLGRAFAGSSYDEKTGKLVVMVSDAKQLAAAEAAGAEARLVEQSMVELDGIKKRLDTAAGVVDSSGPTDRKAGGKRGALVAGMTSWYIDEATNSVHVTVKKGQKKAAARALAKYGEAVTIEETDYTPTATANFMDGGDGINGNSCSAGFNLRNPSTGQGFLLTAGHCVSAGQTLTGQGGVAFGPVLESWFPGFDDAIARNNNPGFWIQGPWVDTNPSNGGFINTSGFTDAPVNTFVCKSGITTKWTCGFITAKNETVTYNGGQTVSGLTRHSACVEPGDSGGANVSVTNAYRAEGVTSGASLFFNLCLSRFGLTNVSWYFPIADSLPYYGARYGVTVW